MRLGASVNVVQPVEPNTNHGSRAPEACVEHVVGRASAWLLSRSDSRQLLCRWITPHGHWCTQALPDDPLNRVQQCVLQYGGEFASAIEVISLPASELRSILYYVIARRETVRVCNHAHAQWAEGLLSGAKLGCFHRLRVVAWV